MAPRTEAFKKLQQRLRRSLKYGDLRIDCLTAPLSQMVIEYFDHHSHYDYLDTDFATSSIGGFVDPCTLVAAMIYIERLRVRKPKSFMARNPNELYLAALIIANKFMFDGNTYDYVWLDDWVEEAKVDKSTINQLELRMLYDLEWDLMISGDEYEHTLHSMERYVATRSLKQSGILSYGDAHVLLKDMKPLMDQISRFLTMCASLTSAYLLVLALSVGTYLTAQKSVSNANVNTTTSLLNMETSVCGIQNVQDAYLDSSIDGLVITPSAPTDMIFDSEGNIHRADSILPVDFSFLPSKQQSLLEIEALVGILQQNRTYDTYTESCQRHNFFRKHNNQQLILAS
ncbi:unnamed protein product [Bursaphelenchus okinawaensis]|uniref:Protein CNPPD1 n=1 Tax=Bursaphelenchus okinawaensis TaxID=465554 RepID=A0A811LD59_9BILA|nr:unnamed protein product [Bursaphelenchus okinawaensis]CAG9120392.1 unnamed protein product [Bursaphelenchus okinawaensis]